MREIKFRVWYKPTRQFLHHCSVGNGIIQHDKQNFTVLKDEDCIVQQYTGQKDPNGIEIYEGDLLSSYNTTVLLVHFNNENYGGVLGWNLLRYGDLIDDLLIEEDKEEWRNSDIVYYPAEEFYYGMDIRNCFKVIGNILEGIK